MAGTLIFRGFATSVLAGLIAGGVLEGLNLAIIQPYIDLISENTIDELMADGEYDEEEFDSKLRSIYLSQTVGALAMGLGAGALIGGARVFGKRTFGEISYAILIAGIAWFVLYAVPAAKYPPSAAALFYDEAGAEYYPLYFGYVALSGFAALGVAIAFRRFEGRNKLFGMAALYLVIVAVAFFLFPAYDQDSLFDQSILNSWRAATSAAMTAFWFSAGGIAGLLWKYGSVKKS
jgi:hypothetical protein